MKTGRRRPSADPASITRCLAAGDMGPKADSAAAAGEEVMATVVSAAGMAEVVSAAGMAVVVSAAGMAAVVSAAGMAVVVSATGMAAAVSAAGMAAVVSAAGGMAEVAEVGDPGEDSAADVEAEVAVEEEGLQEAGADPSDLLHVMYHQSICTNLEICVGHRPDTSSLCR